MKHKYITVDVPDDMFDTDEPELDNMQERANYAIYLAREALPFCVPCNWRVLWDNGQQVRVAQDY